MGESPGDIAARLAAVRGAIARASERAARAPDDVTLVAVTKTVHPDRIREAYEAGARVFGENYVQEALGKIGDLPPEARWHLIGHLQSNKARRVVETFEVLHCLDRPSLGDALEKAARARGVRLEVLVQVNVGDEESKSGATADQALDLVRRAPEWPSLRVRGLMAIPPYREDPEEVRPYFRALRELRDRATALAVPGVAMAELSMGMSHDFEVAVEEGATLVRVGSAIFGERE